jgi:hypothetical protein
MNNGSEKIPERPRITNWIENVPVRGLAGEIIGRAKVSDKGEVIASIDLRDCAKETFDKLGFSTMYNGLTIAPYAVPAVTKNYTDEVRTRLAEQNPFNRKD